jgi:hypothetical protein
MRDYLKENLEIKKAIDLISKKRQFCCVYVREIAQHLHKDPRTIQSHMQIMENYDCGLFIDEKKALFCTKEGLKKIAEKIDGKK